jgi:tRNA threonylcarbamoyladenosine biosynthesis protein TsaB
MKLGLTLAVDTAEARGSIALRQEGRLACFREHDNDEDYSSWLLPAVHDVLRESGSKLENVALLAVATGPGSFTGLRVGLTTVKAWAEVYGTPLAGVSRLEALAHRGPKTASYLAACYDAQRGQIFGGLFRRAANGIEAVAPETVLEPAGFLGLISTACGANPVSWVTPDPSLILSQRSWQERVTLGDRLICPTEVLADSIGELAEVRARREEFSDPVTLEANYVRRSDAELFWKGNTKHVR